LTGCTAEIETEKVDTTLGVPSPFLSNGACEEDADCVLTDALYDPCGRVYAIHMNTSEDAIERYNELQMRITEGRQYDCDMPPKIEDYRALCEKRVCTARQR